MKSDVLVMGGGATGQLAAAYLRMRFPNLKVAVIEGLHKNRPIVGESFVEVTVDLDKAAHELRTRLARLRGAERFVERIRAKAHCVETREQGSGDA